MTPTREALLEAINDLIHDPDPRVKKSALDSVISVGKNYPVRLTGDMRVLNPLVDLALADPDAWEAVKKLIDDKRMVGGLPPAWPAPERPRFNIREYQRQLMAQIRERGGRAVELENLQRSDRDKLIGAGRAEFMRRQTLEWGKRRDKALDEAAQVAGRKLSKVEQDAVRSRFWASIDDELDSKEAQVRAELLKPPHQRRKI